MADTIDDEVRKHYEIHRVYVDDQWFIVTTNAARMIDYYTREDALAAARAHRAAVIESSPEVAALRARVAELEAEVAERTRQRDEAREIAMRGGWERDELREMTASLRAALEAVDDKLTTAFEQDIADARDIIDAALATVAPPAPKSLYRSNCPKKGHCVRGCLRTEPCRAEQTPTYGEVVAAAQRAAQEVENWPQWKRALSEPASAAECTHPKDRRIATYDEPGAFTCVACGLSVSTMSPPEPDRTPTSREVMSPACPTCGWANSTLRKRCRNCRAGLVQHPDPEIDHEVRMDAEDGRRSELVPSSDAPAPDPWALPEELYWSFLPSRGWSISSRNDDGGWALRPDADYLVVLLRKRNADEPDGPACWACGSCGCRNPKGGPAC